MPERTREDEAFGDQDLRLQKEVAEGRVEVSKIRGEENPANVMTKILGIADIESRLARMNMRVVRE